MAKAKSPNNPVVASGHSNSLQPSIDSDLRFRKLIENSFSGISLLDKDLNIIYRSPAAERITGWSNQERKKNTLSDLTYPADRGALRLLLDEVAVTPGLSKTCSFKSKHFNGHFIWLESTYTNMLKEPGIEAIVCNFIDVTAKKQTEESLQQTYSELFAYKYALDESAIVAITDQKGIIRKVNEKFCKISKYTEGELIGQDHRMINSGYHDKAFIRRLWGTIAGGKIWKGEFKNRAKDGSFYWVSATIVPFLNEKGKPYQYIAIRTDITELKLKQEKIIESERFIKTIADNLPALIAYWTADLRCLFANKPYLDWFDKQAHEMQGISKGELLGQNEFKLYESHIRAVLEGQPQRFERTFYKSNGQHIFTDTQYLPDREGDIIKGFYSLIYDVTAVKIAEQEVISKSKQIEDLLENITDGFIAIDEGMKYTYGNRKIEEIFGVPVSKILGKTVLEVFPGAAETETYKSIKKALWEKVYVCTEDHYEPLNLWQENRIYPSGNGVSMFIRDISERKNAERQEALLLEISRIFNEPAGLTDVLDKVLELLVNYGNFSGAEFWLVGADKKRISVAAKFTKPQKKLLDFVNHKAIKSYARGEGLVGLAWEANKMQYWVNTDKDVKYERLGSAIKAGLKKAYAFPLEYNREVIGVLAFGIAGDEVPHSWSTTIFESFTSRFGAEIKRKQAEQELNQIFSFAPDIICIAGIDGYFKRLNPAMPLLLGYTEPELLSRPYIEFVHPDDRESTCVEVENIFGGTPAFYFENRYITRSGKIKWLAWTATVASEEGLLFCVAKDITYKKELEELLHTANTLARIGAWETDLKTGIMHCSDITREIHEVAPDFEFTIEKAVIFYKEGENRETITKIMTEAMQNGVPADEELQIITAKGNIKWVRVIVEAEFSEGKCSRLFGSFQDIDARKKAEIEGKKALEDRNTILESIDDAFFAVDKNWVVTYWNQMAEKVLQTPKDKILDHNLWEIFLDSVGSESYKKYHEAVETNLAAHFEDYYPSLAKWYEISAFPSETGLSVYFKDITERKASETRLKELNTSLQKHAKELAISNAELEQFAYVASHDLQEPLRMVTSFMSQLEKKYGDIIDDKGKQYIHFAVDGAKRMRQIILDLLEFSRVGRTEDDLEEVDLNKLVDGIVALHRKQIEEKHARILFDNLPVVNMYKTPVRQVLQNLISNGLKYQLPGAAPVINISCEETTYYWIISVKDNGIGIDKAYFDKIFIIFQRLHNKDEYAGTGMGLAITKKIIENLGGRVWVESTEGQGSTFYFTILKK